MESPSDPRLRWLLATRSAKFWRLPMSNPTRPHLDRPFRSLSQAGQGQRRGGAKGGACGANHKLCVNVLDLNFVFFCVQSPSAPRTTDVCWVSGVSSWAVLGEKNVISFPRFSFAFPWFLFRLFPSSLEIQKADWS